MNEQRIHYLYHRYLQRKLSPTELEEFRSAVESERFEQVVGRQMDKEWDLLPPELINQVPDTRIDAVYKVIAKQIIPQQSSIRISIFRRLIPYAAILAVLMTVGYLIWNQEVEKELQANPIELSPGGNHAKLTMSDGSFVQLSDEQNGIIVGEEIAYQDGTPLGVFTSQHYQIDVPLGGQYQVTLPDGSNVWLNSGSSLKYPAHFDNKERIVELTGEAYFEVQKKRDKIPFLVKTPSETVEVLGTEFNLSAYPDDPTSMTTLLSGSVRVTSSVDGTSLSRMLIPGQQAIVAGKEIEVQQVNVDDFTAWRDGMFRFNEDRLDFIMRQLARWYNVEVEFRNEAIKRDAFTGNFTRRENASHILKALEKTGEVKFIQEGRKIIIDRKNSK